MPTLPPSPGRKRKHEEGDHTELIHKKRTKHKHPDHVNTESHSCLARELAQDLGNLLTHATCVICTGVFVDPVSIDCGHTFCRRCIETWFETKRECAMCRVIPFSRPSPNLIAKQMVDHLIAQSSRLCAYLGASEKIKSRLAMVIEEHETAVSQHEEFIENTLRLAQKTHKKHEDEDEFLNITQEWTVFEKMMFATAHQIHWGEQWKLYCGALGFTSQTVSTWDIKAINTALENMEYVIPRIMRSIRCGQTLWTTEARRAVLVDILR